MSSLIDHAKNEFRIAGWIDEEGNFEDEMQEAVCNNVLELLQTLADQGHSGTSVAYVTEMFTHLVARKILAPLTGEDDEWEEVEEGLSQNKRAGHVFKDSQGAFDINGIIWEQTLIDENDAEYTVRYTNNESVVPVEFPYKPDPQYRSYVEEE